MTPAEFDTRRRMLGLSIIECGQVCALDGRPVSEKSVRRWISGEHQVPPDAIDAIEELEDAMRAAVNQLVETVTSRSMAGPIALRRYRDQDELDASVDGEQFPVGAHAIYTGWAADALVSEGIATEILWADMAD